MVEGEERSVGGRLEGGWISWRTFGGRRDQSEDRRRGGISRKTAEGEVQSRRTAGGKVQNRRTVEGEGSARGRSRARVGQPEDGRGRGSVSPRTVEGEGLSVGGRGPTFEQPELVGAPALRRVAVQDAEQLPPVVGVLRRLVVEQETAEHTRAGGDTRPGQRAPPAETEQLGTPPDSLLTDRSVGLGENIADSGMPRMSHEVCCIR